MFDLESFNMIKTFPLLLVVIIGSVQYLKTRQSFKKSKDNEEDMITKYYEKNEEGLYPWEVDTNHSPERIEKDAKPFKRIDGPKRGGW